MYNWYSWGIMVIKIITRPAGRMYNQAVRESFTLFRNLAHQLEGWPGALAGISATAMGQLLC
jgi:hypothetical protein